MLWVDRRPRIPPSTAACPDRGANAAAAAADVPLRRRFAGAAVGGRAAGGAPWAFLIPVFIVVGLRYGVVTATEAGATTALRHDRHRRLRAPRAHSDTRPLPGRFMAIEQAAGTPRGRDAALPWLRAFVEERKASGFVARALAESGQAGAEVAPASP